MTTLLNPFIACATRPMPDPRVLAEAAWRDGEPADFDEADFVLPAEPVGELQR